MLLHVPQGNFKLVCDLLKTYRGKPQKSQFAIITQLALYIFLLITKRRSTMTKINIVKTNPVFVANVKSEMAARKQRFSRYFSIISGTRITTIGKLKQMKDA